MQMNETFQSKAWRRYLPGEIHCVGRSEFWLWFFLVLVQTHSEACAPTLSMRRRRLASFQINHNLYENGKTKSPQKSL